MLHPIARSLIADPSPEAVEVALDLYREGRWGAVAPHELYLLTGAPGPLAMILTLARESGGERAERALLCQLAELQLRELIDSSDPEESLHTAARARLAGPLWEHLLPYAEAGRLCVRMRMPRHPQIRIGGGDRDRPPQSSWSRLWSEVPVQPAPYPCIEPVRLDGQEELAPPTGRLVVPLDNARDALAFVCQCAPAPWGLQFDMEVRDRLRDDAEGQFVVRTGTRELPGLRWHAGRPSGRWLEVRQVSATEAELSWGSGTDRPSRYLGQDLAYAGLLGLPPQPPSPPFGVLASAMRRAMVAEDRERRG